MPRNLNTGDVRIAAGNSIRWTHDHLLAERIRSTPTLLSSYIRLGYLEI